MLIDKEKLNRKLAQNIMSVKKLSLKSGVSTTTIARICKGTQKARPETIGKLARALSVDILEIISKEG